MYKNWNLVWITKIKAKHPVSFKMGTTTVANCLENIKDDVMVLIQLNVSPFCLRPLGTWN